MALSLVYAQTTNKSKLAAEVKTEFLHAWNGYKKHAWGNDDLKPLSKSFHNWYPQPLLMTPVDALDTMYLMGFKDEADKTRKYITDNLNFDKDISVQNFEITIRLLGGLLSSYQITGDKKLLTMADDLGTRLLPVFDSPTGLPYKYVNLKTGKTRGEVSNPAETGTLLIEFGTLSKLTGKPIYYEKAKRALVETYKRRSLIGLVGTNINVENGKWTNTDSHISAEIDSYYEYLLKCAVLFDDKDCRKMWEDSITAINKNLADEVRGELWYGHADMKTGKRTETTTGALDATSLVLHLVRSLSLCPGLRSGREARNGGRNDPGQEGERGVRAGRTEGPLPRIPDRSAPRRPCLAGRRGRSHHAHDGR